jgi:hypothetical protein
MARDDILAVRGRAYFCPIRFGASRIMVNDN